MKNDTAVTFGTRMRYRFDNIMSKGAPALMGLLGLTSVILVSIFALVVWVTNLIPKESPDAEDYTYFEAFWKSLMRTLDPGTMGGDEGAFGLVMLLVTLVGIFILSALIGIINTGIGDKLDNLRKGRSKVIENNHTVILGWSSKIYTLVSEIIAANMNRKNPAIVILADKDKVEMEDDLKTKIGDFKNTRIVCRTGSSIDMDDLNLVNPNGARSIVVLSPEEGMADAHVIKTVLAIVNNPVRKKDPYHIVAEIKEPSNASVAEMVGKDELCVLLSDDLISRITVQTCRHSGLSVVFIELLDFGGVEIYFQNEQKLTGKSFREAVFAYDDSAIFGLRKKDGKIVINPQADTKIESDDQLIAIAEDDDTIVLSGKTGFDINTSVITGGVKADKKTDQTLILGWNHKAPTIIKNLDDYVASGSEITIVADDEQYKNEIEEVRSQIKNQAITFIKGDTTDRELLDSLGLSKFHNVVILCYSDMKDIQEADSLTMITLLHLRDIVEKTGVSINVVSEMLDIRNRELAAVTKVNDFIVSDKLTSLMLAQLSENKELKGVFEDLFDEEGNEIYLKPVTRYIKPGQPVNFYTILESAMQKNEIAIGYKLEQYKDNHEKAYGIVVSPKKSEMIPFTDKDKIIVISED